jgi:hypothetical protein
MGLNTGGVGAAGIYAFEVSPGVVTLGVKPSNADFTPGEIVLRIQNDTADQITDLEIGYDLWVNNNEPYATAWSFHHSADDLSYVHMAAGDYTSTEAGDGLGWQKNTLSVEITGLAIDHGEYYYLKWASDDVSGHAKRDEFGLDEITIAATVTEVNYAPDAVEDSGTTPEDTSLTIDVLSNDTDPDDDTLLLASFTQPSNGSVVRDENGTPLDSSDDNLEYIPDLNWSGVDNFTYMIDDGQGETDTAAVTVTVSAVNDPPEAVDDTVITSQDTPVTVDVLLNDTDPELDNLSLISFTQPSNGFVNRDDNGTPADLSDDQLIYTPAGGWSGADLFTYTIDDGNGETDTANVSVTVEPTYPYVIYLPLVAR